MYICKYLCLINFLFFSIFPSFSLPVYLIQFDFNENYNHYFVKYNNIIISNNNTL